MWRSIQRKRRKHRERREYRKRRNRCGGKKVEEITGVDGGK